MIKTSMPLFSLITETQSAPPGGNGTWVLPQRCLLPLQNWDFKIRLCFLVLNSTVFHKVLKKLKPVSTHFPTGQTSKLRNTASQ